MSKQETEWKTLRVREEAWEKAREQKQEEDRTWSEQIVREEEHDDVVRDIRAQLARLSEDYEPSEGGSAVVSEELIEELEETRREMHEVCGDSEGVGVDYGEIERRVERVLDNKLRQ